MQRRDDGGCESASGPGSSREAAKPTQMLLRRTLRQRGIKTVLDLGCGDWNWMQQINLPDVDRGLDIAYEGWDASPDLVDELNEKHGLDQKIKFSLRDITTEPLPKVDLIITRDVLFHLPLSQSVPLVERIRESCRFFLSTSFLTVTENSDIAQYLKIEGWGFYRINLNIAPFDLGEQLIEATQEPLGRNGGKSRFICLFKFE